MAARGKKKCWACGMPVLLIVLSIVLGLLHLPIAQAASETPADPAPRLQAVLLNGGGRPALNYYSHLLHVRQLTEVLQHAGVAPEHIVVFNADGADPQADFAVRDVQSAVDFWLLQGTKLERPLRPPLRYENSVLSGFTLRPATRAALQSWFAEAAQTLRPGDTLLFYVTDHGTRNAADLTDNAITLWGEGESLSVSALRALFAGLDPQVRIVSLMSQCYSGSFANLMYASPGTALPSGNVCGFFASTADRQAYGCYPENRDKDHIGHSFHFIEALAAGDSFAEAHRRVLVTDQTPDVPLTTSEVYLEKLLDDVAQARGQSVEALVDGLLQTGWEHQDRWEPEIRLLDRIGQVSGSFSPRSLAELQEHASLLPNLSQQFSTYGKAWRAALESLTSVHLERFLSGQPVWQESLRDKALSALSAAERQALTHTFLADLVEFTQADVATSGRLHSLQDKAQGATQAAYRMQVRLGIVLRLRSLLSSVAGRQYLAQDGTPEQRQAYARLTACEALTLGKNRIALRPPEPVEPFPAYETELKLVEAVLPGWMGIRFQQAEAAVRSQFNLPPGASVVQAVYPDSPASQARLAVGDIVLGPPEAPFREPRQIREWIMTAPLGAPLALQILRGEQFVELTLTPQRYPLKWPSLPGPPAVGSGALPLPDLQSYRGTLPAALVEGGPYLLFFWATWCAPCKAAVPEVLAFEQATGVPVLAITDESAEKLEAFFKTYAAPFPAMVAVDKLRRAFLAYGVSGTPTFVLIDAGGKVQSLTVGYQRDAGLSLPGWTWARP